jgi:hypothetical protein
MKIILTLFLIIVLNCTNDKIGYISRSIPKESNNYKKNIVIDIINDKRVGTNRDHTFLFIIPLFPYGPYKKDFPENGEFIIPTPLNYFISEVIEIEVKKNFKNSNVILSNDRNLRNDIHIGGNLNLYYCEERFYTFGLSLFGPILWYTGLNFFEYKCEIDLDIKITIHENTKTINIKESDNSWKGMYNFFKKREETHSFLGNKISKKILIELKELL